MRTPDHWRNGVSEATQATFMRQQAEQIARWPYVKVNIWFNLLDAGGNRADKYSNCGLLRVDGTAKPAFAAFRGAATTLAGGGTTANAATVKKRKRSAAQRRKARRARAARRRARARRHHHSAKHR